MTGTKSIGKAQTLCDFDITEVLYGGTDFLIGIIAGGGNGFTFTETSCLSVNDDGGIG